MRPGLIVVADDYGLAPAYDAGIAEAARAGAVDAVSVIATRAPDPAPLLDAGVEIGLHLELDGWSEEPGARRRADAADREAAVDALRRQLDLLAAIAARPPAYVDGHHHCHAAPGLAAAVGREAARRGLAVRSVGPRHRRTLRCLGASTPDRLVGRLSEREPVIPPELRALISDGEPPPTGITEWMVHPGHPDPGAGSSYDAGREQDLHTVLELAGREDLRALRTTHRDALG